MVHRVDPDQIRTPLAGEEGGRGHEYFDQLRRTTHEVSQGRIFEQDQIARAAELGVGIKSPEQIQLVTDDPDSEAFANQVRDILLK